MAAQVHVEPRVRFGDLDIEGLRAAPEHAGEVARDGGSGLAQGGRRDRAVGDVYEVVAARGHEADEHPAVRVAGVQRQAAAALAVGVRERLDRGRDARRLQRRRDEAALPGRVGGAAMCWAAQPPQVPK
jgi:hypothetical protein